MACKVLIRFICSAMADKDSVSQNRHVIGNHRDLFHLVRRVKNGDTLFLKQ